MSAGYACTITGGGAVECWRSNDCGQLGIGNFDATNSPQQVVGIGNAIEVSAGIKQTCALLSDATVSCWGDGLLGDGPGSASATPVAVAGISTATSLTGVTEVVSGQLAQHTGALRDDGTVSCWGANTRRQLGSWSARSAPSGPSRVTLLGAFRPRNTTPAGERATTPAGGPRSTPARSSRLATEAGSAPGAT